MRSRTAGQKMDGGDMEERQSILHDRERLKSLFESIMRLPRAQQGAALEDVGKSQPHLAPHLRNLLSLGETADVLLNTLSIAAPENPSEWEKLMLLARETDHHPPHLLRQILVASGDAALVAEPALKSLRRLYQQQEEAPGSKQLEQQRQDHPAPGTHVGRYRIAEPIGEGGMGIVFRAVDATLGRSVALKFLPPYLATDRAARARLEREAKAASALDHPNIGYVHEIAEAEDGRLYIAMAYYEGETLQQKIERGPLPIDFALEIALQVADGLSRAHAAGIIHRDVKPANIIITTDGLVKIVDFGLAISPGEEAESYGQRVGTTAYMSPEQARGEETDRRTDIWSLGVILYEMIAGDRPFGGAYEAAVVYALLNTDPRPLDECRIDAPRDVVAAVDRCLQKSREVRFSDVESVRAQLRKASEALTTRGSFIGRPVWTMASRNARLLGGGAGLLLIALMAFGVWMRTSLPDERHLVVLPFDVIGESDHAAAFSAGVVQTLTSRLTQLEQFEGLMWVVPSSDVPEGMTTRDAREQFGATIVVTGSVQFEEQRLRLTLNLIDARTRRQLGSEQIDYQHTNSLALQDEAALVVARMLRVRLQPELQQLLLAGGTQNSDANSLYLRGWGYLRDQERLEDLDRAIALFEAATELDGSFALAWAGLGEAYWHRYQATDEVEWVEHATRSSERALELNSDLSLVHVTLGTIQAGLGRFAEAQESFDRALAIDPENSEVYRQRATAYRNEGRYRRAEEAYRRAVALKPDYWRGHSSLGVFFYTQGRFEEAVAAFRRGLELAPSNQALLVNTGAAYWEMMRLEEAVEMFERVLEVYPTYPEARANLATAYFYLGRFRDAAHLYEAELGARPSDYIVQGFLADSYYWMGDRDRANQTFLQAIESARAHQSVRGHDPDFAGTLAGQFARVGEADSARFYLALVEHTTTPAEAHAATAFGIGEVYESLGDRAEALRWMRPALESGWGWMQIRHSPWLHDLRRDPIIIALDDSLAIESP